MMSGQLHAPAALPPEKEPPGTHWIGGWVGPRAVLKAVVKRKFPSPRRESNPRYRVFIKQFECVQLFKKVLTFIDPFIGVCSTFTPVTGF
jgi:hypothetical protein